MAQDLRIELEDMANFMTIRLMHSELWFINNQKLEDMILGILAKNQERHGVIIYGHDIMGNHLHLLAEFPNRNRAAFTRDFHSMVAKLTNTHAKGVERGRVFERRYSTQIVPTDADVEDRFFYLALNPVLSGLTRTLGEYPGYLSFFDSVKDIRRVYTLIDWGKYRDKKRFNKKLRPSDFQKKYTLTYSRLPGYEDLSQAEYERVMRDKLEERRLQAVQDRIDQGKGFAPAGSLKKTKPGTRPRSTKTSTRHSKRPLVLTKCPKARQWFLDLYFKLRAAYTEAYEALKNGESGVTFPPNTYPPVLLFPSPG